MAADTSRPGACPVIVVTPDLWHRRYELWIDPPNAAYPLRIFRTLADALTAAEDLHRAEGWSIDDRAPTGSVE